MGDPRYELLDQVPGELDLVDLFKGGIPNLANKEALKLSSLFFQLFQMFVKMHRSFIGMPRMVNVA